MASSNELLRVLRRRTSLETKDAGILCQTEFRTKEGELDLRPSVYETTPERALAIQVFAEHSASVPLDPPRGGCLVDVTGLFAGAVVPTTGKSLFEYTRIAHREVRLTTVADLLEMGRRLVENGPRQRYDVTKEELRTYVGGHMGAQDPEWTRFATTSPKGPDWVRFAT